jgi:hypothetical protein
MILRVLRVDEAIADKVLAQPGYKGSFTPFVNYWLPYVLTPGDA